ncbi:MAG: GNAT family N-acetyltransferase [Actinomycetota bacterium]|nr:GNAT family N-acetyltransferase [Actinomycetota bacterium]
MRIRAREEADVEAVELFLADHGSLRVARLVRLERTLDHPALLAENESGELAGVLTYVASGEECEILTLHAARQWAGTGTALVEALQVLAGEQHWGRLWVQTTNDNVDALRFYQRRGFRLVELRPGAVDAAREVLKPEIPRAGAYGIPLRDELVLEMRL